MPAMLTVQLARPIATVHVTEAPPTARRAEADFSATARGAQDAHEDRPQDARPDSGMQHPAKLCAVVRGVADKLNSLYEETIADNRKDIARLAVEIARKILAARVARGDYDMQAVIEEALKCAPSRRQIVVRVNPEDLRSCQQLQQGDADGSLHGIEFVPDPALAPADCLVETPKGIVKSFVEEHLERVAEALLRVE